MDHRRNRRTEEAGIGIGHAWRDRRKGQIDLDLGRSGRDPQGVHERGRERGAVDGPPVDCGRRREPVGLYNRRIDRRAVDSGGKRVELRGNGIGVDRHQWLDRRSVQARPDEVDGLLCRIARAPDRERLIEDRVDVEMAAERRIVDGLADDARRQHHVACSVRPERGDEAGGGGLAVQVREVDRAHVHARHDLIGVRGGIGVEAGATGPGGRDHAKEERDEDDPDARNPTRGACNDRNGVRGGGH